MKRLLAFIAALLLMAASITPALAGDKTVFAYQGKVAFFAEDGKFGLQHKSGSRTMIAAILEDARPFVGGLANVKMDGLWGIIDQDSRWVFRPGSFIPIDFGDAKGKHGLYSPKPGFYGFISRKGEVLLEPMALADAGIMAEGLFAAGTEAGYGYLDASGKEVIPFQYEAALAFSQGLAAVKKDGKWGYINPQGETVLDFIYAQAGSFVRDLAPVRAEGESYVSYIDQKGKAVLTGEWDFGGDFTKDKLARVGAGGKYGYINLKGKAVVTPKYDEAGDFGDGFAPVKTGNGSWVFVDKSGKVVSKNYIAAGEYQDGFALVTYQGEEKNAEPETGYVTVQRKFVIKNQ